MKTKLFAAAVIVITLAASVPAASAAPQNNSLKGVAINVCNWGEYISNGEDGSMNVNAEFEKATGIKVNYSTFESNESLYTKLRGGGVSYDVIIPSDYMISKLIAEDRLEPLNFDNIPNYENIGDEFKTDVTYDKDMKYSVPYTWGTVGILYNTEVVDTEVTSWDILWDKKYRGDILMFDNPRDAFGIAQKKLGYSYNSTDRAEWDKAAEELKAQKPILQAYVMDQIFEKMLNGTASLAPYYAGDFMTIYAENEDNDIAFAIPEEGTNRFIDAMCIPKGCKQKAAAEAYINFLCDPEVALANIEYICYSSPVTEAAEAHKAEIEEEYGEEMAAVIYPDEVNGETFDLLPEDLTRYIDDLWVAVKANPDNSPYSTIWIISGFLAILIAVKSYKYYKAKKLS